MDRVYTLRRAVPADAKEIAGLFQRSVRGLSSKNYSPLHITTWARLGADDRQWEDRIQSQYVLLSVYAEAVVGFVGYEDDGHIDTLYVCPDHARQGVASRLFANILSAVTLILRVSFDRNALIPSAAEGSQITDPT